MPIPVPVPIPQVKDPKLVAMERENAQLKAMLTQLTPIVTKQK